MPIIESSYRPSWIFRNGHLNTIIPNQFREITEVAYVRERLELQDGDFVDLDFSCKESKSLVLILHGLEGDSTRVYAKGLVREANLKKMDACVLNQRGCSGSNNRLLQSYHSGWTEDLRFVIEWLIDIKKYDSIYIAGVSVGGNMTLKYLGEEGSSLPHQIKAAATVSVPVDLHSCVRELAKKSNWIYMQRFLKTLKAKAKFKLEQHSPSGLNADLIMNSKSFMDYDHEFTAKINGFDSGLDYWTKNSSGQFISEITIPTLLLTSLDDPFLGPECYPFEEAKNNSNFHLLVTKYGGHVGFVSQLPLNEKQFQEEKVFEFFESLWK